MSQLNVCVDDTSKSWVHVVLQQSRIYSHKILRLYYTTYNVRRDEDVIHIGTPQCNDILLNDRSSKESNEEHVYLYAKVLGVFHTNVAYVGGLSGEEGKRRQLATTFQRMDFVWVHWYNYLGPRDELSLDRLSLSPLQSGTALDFLDPQDILRGVHLVPQFSLGQSSIPRPSFQFSSGKGQDLWKSYYINRYVLLLCVHHRQL